ncbi:hypothetical protein L1987_12667 [Smallanthus sonchifolius]|uniref:Uncharacterized protein n=1 Tax=Smallanthus sonchifolius TaxID=185202 RepID=A0ACB9JGK8_9ASTR|nr:hypothetical protein L1987_12667 [Smallanthus sonchifolius]
MPPIWGADRIGFSLGSHRPTVILKLPCLVEKKKTKLGAIHTKSFTTSHVPTTTSAAILTSMESYGGSPATAPTPLPGALI